MVLPQGPVAILWDIENCGIPSDVSPEEVAVNIRTALGGGNVTMFSAYGDFHSCPIRVREGCQRTGIKLVDVPNGRKDAADKAILVDLFLFALDNRPPSSIMLISGDVDFAQALHILGQRGYTIILAIPPSRKVSPALCSAGRFVWDWSSLARGVGMPSSRPLMPFLGVGRNEVSSCPMGFQITGNQDALNEEAIMHQRMSIEHEGTQMFVPTKKVPARACDGIPLLSPAISKHKKVKGSQSKQVKEKGLDHLLVSRSSDEVFDDKRVVVEKGPTVKEGKKKKKKRVKEDSVVQKTQTQSIHQVKGQLLKLLKQSGGWLTLSQIPQEYQKYFSRPLRISGYDECGSNTLEAILQKFSYVMTIKGEGTNKIVYHNTCYDGTINGTPLSSPLPSKNKEGKGKGILYVNEDAHLVSGSSDDQRAVMEEGSVVKERQTKNMHQVKGKLIKLLGKSGGCLALSRIPPEYQKFFGQPLCALEFGVCNLVDLLQKFSHAMTIEGEGANTFVYLKNSQRGKDIGNGNDNAHLASRSSDKLSDDKRVVLEESSIEERQNELKGQLMALLQHSGGFLAFNHISQEYHKLFGQRLNVSEYGARKLETLLQKFSSMMTIKGRGSERLVYLNNSQASVISDTPLLSPSPSNDKKAGRRMGKRGKDKGHLELASPSLSSDGKGKGRKSRGCKRKRDSELF